MTKKPAHPTRLVMRKAMQMGLFMRPPSHAPEPAKVGDKGPQPTKIGRTVQRSAPDPGKPPEPTPAYKVSVPGVRTVAPEGVILQEHLAPMRSRQGLVREIPPAGPNQSPRKEVYRLRRFFFPTVKGYEKAAPVEVVEREEWTFRDYKSKTYPFHSMGPRWQRGSVAIYHSQAYTHRLPDGTREQREATNWYTEGPTALLQPLPGMNGPARKVYGVALEGHHVEHVPCDRRCTGATKPKCECSCGGANHGRGNQEVWKPYTAAEVRRLLVELGAQQQGGGA